MQISPCQGLSRGNAPFPLLEVISINKGGQDQGGLRTSLKPPMWVSLMWASPTRSPSGCSLEVFSKAVQKSEKKTPNIFMAQTLRETVQATRKAWCSGEKWKDVFQSTAIKAHYGTWAKTCSQFTFQCKIQNKAWLTSTRIKVWSQK